MNAVEIAHPLENDETLRFQEVTNTHDLWKNPSPKYAYSITIQLTERMLAAEDLYQ